MVMAIDISITPLTPVPALHGVPTNRNDKMVDLIGTAQDALATKASESGPPEHPTITGATSMQSTTARRKR